MKTLEQLKPFGLKELPPLWREADNALCGKMMLQKQSVKRSLPLYDNATSSAYTASGNVTWSHTTTSLANRVGIVHVSTRNSGTIGTVTWGGVTMTPITGTGTGAATQPGTFATTATYVNRLFLIINPPTGAQNISLTGTSLVNTRCTAITYSGAAGLGVGFAYNARTSAGVCSAAFPTTYGQIAVLFGGNAANASTSWSTITGTVRVNTGASGGANQPTMFISDETINLYNYVTYTGNATMAGTTPGATLYGLCIVGVGMEVCWTSISNTGNTVGAGPTTFTCNAPNSDANTVAIVGVSLSTATNATPSFTVTYGGIAMTQVAIQNTGATTSRGSVALYRLWSPPTGAQTVSVAASGVTATKVTGQAVIYRNVDPIAGISGSGAAALASPSFGSLTFKDSIVTVHLSGATTALTIPTNAVYQDAATVNSVTGVGDSWIMMHGPYSAITCGGTSTSPGTVGLWLQGQYSTPEPPAAKVNTLIDPFNSLDSVLWVDNAISYVSGAARIGASNSYKYSIAKWDLLNSSCDLQVGSLTLSGSISVAFGLIANNVAFTPGGLIYGMGWGFGATSPRINAYSPFADGSNANSPGNLAAHTSGNRYRIREDGTSVYWEYSTNNGASWIPIANQTWAAMGLTRSNFDRCLLYFFTFSFGGSGIVDIQGINV